MVTISYNLTREDLAELDAEKRGGDRLLPRIVRIIGGALLGCIGLLVVWQALFFFPWNRPFGNLLIASLGLLFLWMGLGEPGLASLCRNLSDPKIKRELQIFEGKFVYSCGSRTQQFQWLPNRGFKENAKFFFLRAVRSEANLAIPKHALTPDQERSLRQLVEQDSVPRESVPGDGIECRLS